jgi:hypothetical protein
VVLYFLTAGHLFRNADGARLPAAQRVEIVADGATIAVNPRDVDLPAGTAVDIAIVRATVPRSTLEAVPILYEQPALGGVFLIAGRTQEGAAVTVPQRITRRASSSVSGDRDASALFGCAGAPALAEQGVFGVVGECPAGRPPLIVSLAAARSWLSQRIPNVLTPRTATATTQFVVSPRQFAGPEILAPCGEDRTAEIDVPLKLSAGETAIDASATLTNRKALRLGDVKVLTFTNDVVKLRFTLGGEPPPRPPAPCPQGQALITLHVTVVKTPR